MGSSATWGRILADGAPTSPPLPYARHSIEPEDRDAVDRVLDSDRLTQGLEIARFESDLARETETGHAVALSSGSAALHCALRALGVGPGDEVIVPSLTFVATANAVALCGARARFVDVDPVRLTLDPEQVERALRPETRGAIPVHYAGLPADVDGLRRVLGPDRFVLEDACHALGASLGGRAAGALGDAACFSFHPAKAITTGEGGAVTTSDPDLAERVARLRDHGLERRADRRRGLGLPPEWEAEQRGPWVYEQVELSTNYRLTDLGAALGRSQLERLPAALERRRQWADAYRKALSSCDAVELPEEPAGSRSAWHLYPIRLRLDALRAGRAEIYRALHHRGIQVQVHYIPVHLQPEVRERLGTGWGDLPVSEDAYLRLLSLPMFPSLEESDIGRVVDTLLSVLERRRR